MARKSQARSAPMNKGRAVSGGGLTSNKLVTPKPRAGNRALDAIDPGAVDQQGQALGFRGADLMGTPMKDRADLGNYKAWSCQEGPGGSRDVYPSGYQALHGTPVKAEKDTGPDVTQPSKARGFDERGNPKGGR